MIPYDDLVAALTSWRTRQGLPVSAGATAGSGPTAMPAPGSGPTATPGSGPARATPPAPPRSGGYTPPPLAEVTADDSLDVEESALLEEAHYDNEGADYAMNFTAVEHDAESTVLGQAPEPAGRDTRESFGGETEFDPKKPW